MRFPATPGWGPLAAVVCGRLPLLVAGSGCSSPPLLAGVRRPRQWPSPRGWMGGFSWCVCWWRGACARGVCARVCVVCSWWWRRCVCVFRVCWCVCVCVRVWCVAVGFPDSGLPLVWVWVWLVCVGGWSLATPGGGSWVRFPASSGWVSLLVVVGAPRDSWLRAPGAVPRHSWLGSAGGGNLWPLATPGCVSWLRFPATPGCGVRLWRG